MQIELSWDEYNLIRKALRAEEQRMRSDARALRRQGNHILAGVYARTARDCEELELELEYRSGETC